MDIKISLPLLPLRDIVVFPSMVIPLFVGRDKSISALNEVMKKDKKIILVTQKNSEIDDPKKTDVFMYGCEGSILQLLKLPDGSVKVLGVDFRACENYKNGFEAAKNVNCPTLNILGDKDKMCPLKEGKRLADAIDNSEVEIIKNCGHMILLEEADQALAALKRFVTENHPPN